MRVTAAVEIDLTDPEQAERARLQVPDSGMAVKLIVSDRTPLDFSLIRALAEADALVQITGSDVRAVRRWQGFLSSYTLPPAPPAQPDPWDLLAREVNA